MRTAICQPHAGGHVASRCATAARYQRQPSRNRCGAPRVDIAAAMPPNLVATLFGPSARVDDATPYPQSMCKRSAVDVKSIRCRCSNDPQSMSNRSAVEVLSVFCRRSVSVISMFCRCSVDLLSMICRCSVVAYFVRSMFCRCSLDVPVVRSMFCLCSVDVLSVTWRCSNDVLLMFRHAIDVLCVCVCSRALSRNRCPVDGSARFDVLSMF